MRSLHPRGFTLIELLIVVVILGILAAIVIPSFQNMSQEAKHSAFANSLRVLAEAAERYHIKNDAYMPDASSGTWQSEFDGYFSELVFEKPTPLGGVWDTELNSFGVTFAIGAHFTGGAPSAADLLAVDELMDDGNVATGTVRTLAGDRYYYVLAE